MTKQELRKIIKEEVSKFLTEAPVQKTITKSELQSILNVAASKAGVGKVEIDEVWNNQKEPLSKNICPAISIMLYDLDKLFTKEEDPQFQAKFRAIKKFEEEIESIIYKKFPVPDGPNYRKDYSRVVFDTDGNGKTWRGVYAKMQKSLVKNAKLVGKKVNGQLVPNLDLFLIVKGLIIK